MVGHCCTLRQFDSHLDRLGNTSPRASPAHKPPVHGRRRPLLGHPGSSTDPHCPDHLVTSSATTTVARVHAQPIRPAIGNGGRFERLKDLAAVVAVYDRTHPPFGAYATDELHIPPAAFDPALAEIDFGEPVTAAEVSGLLRSHTEF